MTATAPNLARPHVGRLTLRNGDNAVTISAADQRIIVRGEHLAALLDDLTEHEEHETA